MKLSLLLLSIMLACSNLLHAAAPKEMTFSTLDRGSVQRDLRTESIIIGAYKNLGFQVNIVRLPGLRALTESNKGTYDGELRRSNIDANDYPNLIKVDVPVNMINICAFTNSDKFKTISISDLSQLIVGFEAGGKQSTKLANKAKASVPVNKIEQLIYMLKKNRVDLVVGNCDIIKAHIAEKKIAGIYIQQPPLISKKLYHFIHIKHKKLLGKISKQIKLVNNNRLNN
ncbi:MAG: hypothetical protein V7784_06610 [Oceanospirillaceae bacterium]